jgi:hypothetical protein
MRCIIYDKNGANAREVKVNIQNVTWGTGEVTEANIGIPITEPKLDRDLIKQNNLVLLEDEDLIPWGGVLEPPHSWDDSMVGVVAKSPESYLQGRHTSREYSSSATVGSVIHRMIQKTVNQFYLPYKVKKTNIETTGTLGGETNLENGTVIYDALRDIADNNDVVWWFETIKQNGSPLFNFFAQSSRATEGLPIEIGANGNAAWGSKGIVESGKVISSYLAKTRDSQFGVGKTSRFLVQDLLDDYGFYEKTVDVESIPVGGGMPKEVRAEIKKNRAVRLFHIYAYLGELTKTMHPGSVHLLNGSRLGFTGGQRGVSTVVQIIQMLFNESNGVLEVVAFEL